MLVVGNLKAGRAQGRKPPAVAGFHFVDLSELGPDLLARIRPDVVLSPLLGDGFDVFDVAQRLQASSFTGRYRAVAVSLPSPGMVLSEVRNHAPSVDFDIISLPPYS
jgi:hypothetical protein